MARRKIRHSRGCVIHFIDFTRVALTRDRRNEGVQGPLAVTAEAMSSARFALGYAF